jgi:polyphosphate kinase 2 (PPK2 family)
MSSFSSTVRLRELSHADEFARADLLRDCGDIKNKRRGLSQCNRRYLVSMAAAAETLNDDDDHTARDGKADLRAAQIEVVKLQRYVIETGESSGTVKCWDDYSEAHEVMLMRTHSTVAP